MPKKSCPFLYKYSCIKADKASLTCSNVKDSKLWAFFTDMNALRHSKSDKDWFHHAKQIMVDLSDIDDVILIRPMWKNVSLGT